MNKNKIVTFDFDGTLQRKDVQKYAKQLIEKGFDVWVLTTRYDELHKHRYTANPTLDDLYIVIDELGIPKHKVRFTCMEWKALYLKETNVIWHLDDNPLEFSYFKKHKVKTVPIQVNSGNWKNKCNKLLKI